MTVPLDMRNDIRSMDADGVPNAEIARRIHASRNAVAKYADMEDMSPAPARQAQVMWQRFLRQIHEMIRPASLNSTVLM